MLRWEPAVIFLGEIMEASRLLDKLIAEKVFGAKVTHLDQKYGWRIDYITDKEECHEPIYSDFGVEDHKLKSYSTDIKAAWDIIDKFGDTFSFYFHTRGRMTEANMVHWPDNLKGYFAAEGKTASEAICKVALKAIENEETK